MAKEALEGKVAQVLNERELVINIGSEQGVSRGMRFVVLAPTVEIKDPDTHEILDTLDREKVRVQATDVRRRVTVCATYETTSSGGGSFIGMFEPRREVTKTLKSSDALQPLSPFDSYIAAGDRVRQLVQEPSPAR